MITQPFYFNKPFFMIQSSYSISPFPVNGGSAPAPGQPSVTGKMVLNEMVTGSSAIATVASSQVTIQKTGRYLVHLEMDLDIGVSQSQFGGVTHTTWFKFLKNSTALAELDRTNNMGTTTFAYNTWNIVNGYINSAGAYVLGAGFTNSGSGLSFSGRMIYFDEVDLLQSDILSIQYFFNYTGAWNPTGSLSYRNVRLVITPVT
jgi:hypothetical protein